MASQTKIERFGLVAKVLELSAGGTTTREIAAILKAEDGLEISHQAIAYYLRDVRQERAEETRSLVQETIKKTIPRDLEILQEVRDQLDEWLRDPLLKVGEKLQVIDRLNKVVDTRLKYAGAAEPDTVIKQEVMIDPDKLKSMDESELERQLRDALA